MEFEVFLVQLGYTLTLPIPWIASIATLAVLFRKQNGVLTEGRKWRASCFLLCTVRVSLSCLNLAKHKLKLLCGRSLICPTALVSESRQLGDRLQRGAVVRRCSFPLVLDRAPNLYPSFTLSHRLWYRDNRNMHLALQSNTGICLDSFEMSPIRWYANLFVSCAIRACYWIAFCKRGIPCTPPASPAFCFQMGPVRGVSTEAGSSFL